ncbi:hypothetical protein J2046_003761 [Rhizobium petrolearium]|nr:hypothetical protein [Neorhizobium petrolearium]
MELAQSQHLATEATPFGYDGEEADNLRIHLAASRRRSRNGFFSAFRHGDLLRRFRRCRSPSRTRALKRPGDRCHASRGCGLRDRARLRQGKRPAASRHSRQLTPMHILRTADYKRMPWKNGKGETGSGAGSREPSSGLTRGKAHHPSHESG